MTSRGVFRWLALLGLLILVAACAGPQAQPATGQTPGAQGQDLAASGAFSDANTYKIGYIPIGAGSPLFVAVEKGYFSELGLKVELQSFRTAAEMIAPLSLGQLDVGVGDGGTAFFNAINKELDVRMALPLSSMREGHGYQVLVVRKDLVDAGQVASASDLAGRKIGVNALRGWSEYLLSKALTQVGLKVRDVELVVLAFPDMIQALKNGSIDAGLLQYPIAATALQPGANNEPPFGALLLSGDKILDNPQNATFLFGKRLLDAQNKEAAVRFSMAILKADRDLQGDAWRADAQIVSSISKYTNTAEAVVKKTVFPYFEPNGVMNRDSVDDYQAFLVESGYTEYKQRLSLDRVIDDSFQQEALKRLGEYPQ